MPRNFDFTEPERVNLEQASRGCISGTLSEWPLVYKALLKAGCEITPGTRAWEARELAKLVLELETMQSALKGLIAEAEYSASSGLPFNACGQVWTQLTKARKTIEENS